MDVEKKFENNAESSQTSGKMRKVLGTIDCSKNMNLSADGPRGEKTPEEYVRDLRADERDAGGDYYKRCGGTEDENHPESLE